jgi:hypothetical protein
MNTTVIGIDPGASGALSYTNSKEIDVRSQKCHELISYRNIGLNIVTTAYTDKKIVAYIEKVHAMPHDGRSSLFKFGVNYGVWLGLLHSKIGHTSKNLKQIVEVSPQKWMKFWENKIGEKLPKVKKDRKNKLKEIASNYTSEKVTLWNADAILITMYGMYTEQGEEQ